MKILYVLPEYLPGSGGGIISYYAGVFPRLVASGCNVDVLVASKETLDQPEVTLDGVHVSYLNKKYLEKYQDGFDRYRVGYPTFAAFLPLAWSAYEQCGHGAGYDLVETTDFPLLFAPWVISNEAPPVVVSLHGSCGQLEWYANPDLNSIDGDLIRMVERISFSCAPSVYANSTLNSRFWEAATHRPVPMLPPTSIQPRCHDLSCQEKSKSGIVVGRFQNWKGSRVLCKALKKIPDEYVRWIGMDVFDVISRAPHSDTLRKEFPNVIDRQLILEGSKPRDEVVKEIVDAPYLCIPSVWDVLNLSVIEAMSLGTPVICSDRAGASMFIENGKNGFLFNPDNSDELADCITAVRRLSSDEKKNIVHNALKTIENQLNPDRLIAQRLAYYRQVIHSFFGWKIDEWLNNALSPRKESESREKWLLSYTTKELMRAAGDQAMHGICRRLGIVRK